MTTAVDVTALLPAARAGDRSALDEVMRAMYQSLRQLASAQLAAEHGERTLSATELVNESFLRLFAGARLPDLAHRRHLLGVAARAMRQVLIDAARRRNSAGRSAGRERLHLTQIAESLPIQTEPEALGLALDELQVLDPRQAQVVELRFFVGLTEDEIATVMGLSVRTVQREWRIARAWLLRELAASD